MNGYRIYLTSSTSGLSNSLMLFKYFLNLMPADILYSSKEVIQKLLIESKAVSLEAFYCAHSYYKSNLKTTCLLKGEMTIKIVTSSTNSILGTFVTIVATFIYERN